MYPTPYLQDEHTSLQEDPAKLVFCNIGKEPDNVNHESCFLYVKPFELFCDYYNVAGGDGVLFLRSTQDAIIAFDKKDAKAVFEAKQFEDPDRKLLELYKKGLQITPAGFSEDWAEVLEQNRQALLQGVESLNKQQDAALNLRLGSESIPLRISSQSWQDRRFEASLAKCSANIQGYGAIYAMCPTWMLEKIIAKAKNVSQLSNPDDQGLKDKLKQRGEKHRNNQIEQLENEIRSSYSAGAPDEKKLTNWEQEARRLFLPEDWVQKELDKAEAERARKVEEAVKGYRIAILEDNHENAERQEKKLSELGIPDAGIDQLNEETKAWEEKVRKIIVKHKGRPKADEELEKAKEEVKGWGIQHILDQVIKTLRSKVVAVFKWHWLRATFTPSEWEKVAGGTLSRDQIQDILKKAKRLRLATLLFLLLSVAGYSAWYYRRCCWPSPPAVCAAEDQICRVEAFARCLDHAAERAAWLAGRKPGLQTAYDTIVDRQVYFQKQYAIWAGQQDKHENLDLMNSICDEIGLELKASMDIIKIKTPCVR